MVTKLPPPKQILSNGCGCFDSVAKCSIFLLWPTDFIHWLVFCSVQSQFCGSVAENTSTSFPEGDYNYKVHFNNYIDLCNSV